LKQLKTEIEARGKQEEEEDAEEEKAPKKKKEDDSKEDGLKDLKEYFSGLEGAKRSKIFLKFVKLLTSEKDDEPKDKKKLEVRAEKKENEEDKAEKKQEPKAEKKKALAGPTKGKISLTHKKS